MSFEKSEAYRIPEESLLQFARGGFLKRVIVLARLEAGEEAAAVVFLEKILASVALDLHKDTLFAAIQPNESIALAALLRNKQPRAVLSFGIAPCELGLQIELPEYQPVKFLGVTFLWASTLATLEPNRTLKTRLWNALKAMFLS